MKKLFCLGVLLFGALTQVDAQTILRFEVIDGDTFPIYTFDEVILKDLKDPEAEKRYLKLVRDVKRTLPYAKLAAFRLQVMDDNLRMIEDEKERKQYIKKTQKAVEEQFLDDLKNLTIDQGRLLIKLIHRETGKTSYEILDQYTNPFTQIFYQGMARMYGTTLKTSFDPVELYQVEHIIKSLELE
ncbi:MAG: DUF4294 domain-containing protein [Bacteroidota bacterium]|nr:DUF4294 domain-containing protein [Bacteroidota bacterium]MDX5430333.1 DUF4294 domain-containing protein [Bacteroidota bacterium]MDX5469094.1 DUF4294 domain-containing protein [Bacteroidota bacterium]